MADTDLTADAVTDEDATATDSADTADDDFPYGLVEDEKPVYDEVDPDVPHYRADGTVFYPFRDNG